MRRVQLYKYGISFNKIYDYLAAARPIVFGCNALNDPVAEAGAGISVPPENARAMADAVKELACLSSGKRFELGLKGRDYVERNHDIKRLARKLEGVLIDVARSFERRNGICR